MWKSVDTEGTGLDLKHSARPFFTTICDEQFNIKYWEWNVNPLTRMPIVPKADLIEIDIELQSSEKLVLQNPKYDFTALHAIGQDEDYTWLGLDWKKVLDTLIAGHLLASNAPHDLTSMALMELGVNIKPYEEKLRDAVNESRRWARSHRPDWKIAKKGLEGMPSAKEAVWQYDMWLPRAVALEEGYEESHPWWTVLAEYSNADSSVTLPLMKRQLQKIEQRGLDKIYAERLKLLPIAYEMEKGGITANSDRAKELKSLYLKSAARAENICINLSEGKLEALPVNGASNALREVVFNHFGLIASKKTPKGEPSLDKFVLDEWAGSQEVVGTVARNTKAYHFIKNLKDYRKRKTALGYMESYENYWMNIEGLDSQWKRLYPSLNATGTSTTRWSSQNPNFQQISKQELEELSDAGEITKRSARYMFGPVPGEEWWSMDAQNIERRLPVYEVGETSIIELFEKPNDPPYFGSEHALVAHILWTKEFEQCGDGNAFKKKYKSTLYQWTKNFGFLLQYQGGEEKADVTAHKKGAYKLVKSRFKKLDELNKYWVDFANKHGYVETIPDKSVDPSRGYPLQIERGNWGKVSPTTPLSYHIQGSAGQWMAKAMVRVSAFLRELNASQALFKRFMGRYKTTRESQIGYRIIATIHDELLYSFPQGVGKDKWKTNLPIAREVQRLMALAGNDMGIPIPVSVSYHEHNWGEEISL